MKTEKKRTTVNPTDEMNTVRYMKTKLGGFSALLSKGSPSDPLICVFSFLFFFCFASGMQHTHSAGCQCAPDDDGERFSLYRFINVAGLRALNATGGAAAVFRPESDRLGEGTLESDDGDELIVVVPFSGSVRLRKVVVRAVGETGPSEVRLYRNEERAFDSPETAPTQRVELGDDGEGSVERSVMAAKFGDTRVLSMVFPSARGGERIVIHYIGLMGDWTRPQQKLTGVVYESKPQPSDHKTREEAMGARSNMGM